MVEIVGFVVLALIKGALGAAANEAGTEGYRALKAYISAHYSGDVAHTVEQLEHQPQSPKLQRQLEDQLHSRGADNDVRLGQLAQDLIGLIENPAIPDPVEELRRSTGLDAVRRVLDRHVEQLREVRARYAIDDADLLGSRISKSSDIPSAVQAELAQLHERIRAIIQQIAQTIQQGRYADVDRAVLGLDAGRNEQVRAQRLVAADKDLQISYESLRLTVEFFSELNQQVLLRMEAPRDSGQLSAMMFGNAIMIYELTSFVIEFISRFQLQDNLRALHDEAMQSIERTRQKQYALQQRATDDRIDSDVKNQILEDIRWREAALSAVENEWTQYFHEVDEMKEKVRDVHGRIPTLELIRDGAEIQVETLQHLALLRFLRQNSSSIRGAVNTLQGLRLAPMTASRVRVLLGVDIR